MPAVYELPLFRIIQEGLNNIGQHAAANSVLVRLTVDAAGGVVVLVHDDGCGFDPSQLGPADHAGHFGLRQIRERILTGTARWTSTARSARGRSWSLPYHRRQGATMPPIRILIADDHTLVRQGLRRLCEGMGGFTVVAEAENGEQAVALAHTTQPDVILMDIVMPDVDGV